MSACCYIRRTETPCPTQPVVDPSSGTVTGVVTSPGGGTVTTPGGGTVTVPPGGIVTFPPPVISNTGLWFQCDYSSCHNGVGFVRFYNNAGTLLYHGCPSTLGTTKTFIPFNVALLNYGSVVHVDYVHERNTLRGGLTSPCAGGHICSSARFRVGLGAAIIGVADMDNAGRNNANDGGGGLDRYNKFVIPNSIIDDYIASLTPVVPQPPVTPSGVDAVYIDQTKIVVVWNDLSQTETGYEVQRKRGSEAWSSVAVLGANTTQFQDTTPPADSPGGFGYSLTYTYRIRALGSPNSDWSAERVVSTPGPPVPGAVSAVYINQNRITLAWDDPYTNETGYEIERKGETGDFALIHTTGPNVTLYNDTTPPTGGFGYSKTYTYRVRAIGTATGFPSVYGGEGSVTTNAAPTPPAGVRVTYLTQTRIVVTWDDTSTEEQGYELQRRVGTLGDWASIATLPPNATIYRDISPPDGVRFGYDTQYFYRLRLIGANGFLGEWTAPTSATTPAPPDLSKRTVCFNEWDVCTGWTEVIPNAVAAVNYVPVGFKFVTLPVGKTFRIALINYASVGAASVSRGAVLEVRNSAGTLLASYSLNLASNGSPLSTFPFDGTSIDGVPFSIQNIWGVPVDIVAAGGAPGFPGIYFDDSAAYQIV